MTQNREGLPASIRNDRRFFEMYGAGKADTPAGWNTPAKWKTLDEIPKGKTFGFAIGGEGSNYLFIDFDHVFKKNGELTPSAQKAYNRLIKCGKTYTERSLSGSGLHMICDLGTCADRFAPVSNGLHEIILWMNPEEYAALPKETHDKVPKIEMFYRQAGRYVYLTGNSKRVADVARDETAADIFRELLQIREECRDRFGRVSAGGSGAGDDAAQLQADEETLQRVQAALPYISAGDYETWVRIGQACRNIGIPFEVWDEWSKYTDMRAGDAYPNYSPDETAKKWKSFNGNAHWNAGTIIRYARKNGFEAGDDFSDDADSLAKFHLHNKRGEVTGVYDYAIYEHIKNHENLFILGKVPYIYKDGVYSADISGAQLKTMIQTLIYPKFIKAPTTKRIFDLFTSAAELELTAEDLNKYPAHWINFKNGFYDPIERQMIPHDPKYRAINQLPHDFDPSADPDGDKVRAWIESLADPEDIEMLLEYAGYCFTRDTRQQKFMILRGAGGTGKSTFIRMLETAIGSRNVSNISLSQLTQRFATFGLVGKLLNSCADLEVEALEDTSMLKKALGEDRMSAEAKGKDSIFFRNYSKLIFSTNELPFVKSEKTNGFYRRLLVLTMDRVPERTRPDLFAELSGELDAFIHLCVDALERMLKRGTIAESRGSVEAVQQLRNDSDSVESFINECCIRDKAQQIKRSELFLAYEEYCFDSERQALKKSNFFRSMRVKGFTEIKTQGEIYFRGISAENPA